MATNKKTQKSIGRTDKQELRTNNLNYRSVKMRILKRNKGENVDFERE